MSNRTYDLVVLLDADAPTDTRTKIVNDAQTLIGQHGEVKANKDWGTRQLPYLIDHHEEAAYHVFQFESAPDAIAKLDRGLKLTEGVLRFRIFETEAGQTLPPNPPLFKREERGYERPPREAAATLDESAAPAAPAAPAVAPGEAVPATDGVPPEAAPVTVETPAGAESATADVTPAPEAPPAEAGAAPVPEAPPAEADVTPSPEAPPAETGIAEAPETTTDAAEAGNEPTPEAPAE
jgi:ribosomal protein S6